MSEIDKCDCKWWKQLQQLKTYIKEDLAPTCQRLQKENDELQKKLEKINECLNPIKSYHKIRSEILQIIGE